MNAACPLEIDVKTLKSMQDRGDDFILLDVREPGEHAAAAIQGSTLIPLGTLPQRVTELAKGKRIVVHCHHGGRSMRATTWLRQNGFDQASNLAGGIDAWALEIDGKVPRY